MHVSARCPNLSVTFAKATVAKALPPSVVVMVTLRGHESDGASAPSTVTCMLFAPMLLAASMDLNLTMQTPTLNDEPSVELHFAVNPTSTLS